MKNKITFLYTNGNKIFKVYWIAQSKNGDIYHGSYSKYHDGSHYSYHKDGTMHFKSKGKKYSLCKTIPIKDIKDIYQLGSVPVSCRNIEKNELEEYIGNKLSFPVLLDTRLFPKKWTTCIDFSLIKPERMDLLKSNVFSKKNKNDIRLIQIIPDFNPWIVLQLRAFKSN